MQILLQNKLKYIFVFITAYFLSLSLVAEEFIIENNDLRKLSKFNLDKNTEYNQNLYTSHYQIDDDLITDNPIGLICNKLSMISLVSLIDQKQINILMNIFQKLQIKVINFLDTTTSYFFYMKNKKSKVFITAI